MTQSKRDLRVPSDSVGVKLKFSFALAYVITIVAAVIPYPIDTVRRRMTMTSGTGQNYSSPISACIQIFRQEGLMTGYRGFSANILRSLAGGLVLATADELKDFYLSLKKSLS